MPENDDPTTPTDADPTGSDTPPIVTVDNVDPLEAAKAEADKWKALSRKHEDQAKANAKAAEELAAVKASQMSDQEKAVAEAEKRGEMSATTKVAQRLAAAEIKAALTGIVPNPVEVIEDLNLGKYVTADGDVDEDAVAKLAAKYASFAAKTAPADLMQGPRGGDMPTREARIAEATKKGDVRSVIALQNARLVEQATKS